MKYELIVPDEPKANSKVRDSAGHIWHKGINLVDWHCSNQNIVSRSWVDLLDMFGPLELIEEPNQLDVKNSKTDSNFLIYINGTWEEFYRRKGDNKVEKCSGNTPQSFIDQYFD